MSSQNVEVKLKFVVDDSGAKVIDQMTGATKQAAKAEEEYQKKLNARAQAMKEQERMAADLRRMGVLAGPAAPPTIDQLATTAADRIRQQQAVQNELIRRGVIEGPRPPKLPAEPETVEQEAQRKIDAMTRGRAVQEEMARRGYGPRGVLPPTPAAAPAPGRFGRAVAGLRGFAASPTAALIQEAAHKVGEGIEAYTTIGKIQSDAFMSEAQKREASIAAIPTFGYGYKKGLEFSRVFMGDYKRMYAAERERMEGLVRVAGNVEKHELRATLGVEEEFAQYRAGRPTDFFRPLKPLKLDRPAGYDRSTVMGERLYREEQVLLPARQELTKATRRRVEAEHRSLLLDREAIRLRMDANEAEQKYKQYREERQRIGRTGTNREQTLAQDQFAQEDKLHAAAIGLNQAAMAAERRALQGRVAAAQAKGDEKQRVAATRQAEYEVAVTREARVTSQAERLGGMGPLGRMRAEMAFERVKRFGTANSTPEDIAQAELIGGDTVRKMKQRYGESLLPRYREMVGGDEYQDTSVKAAQARTDAAREKITVAQEQAIQTAADAIAKAYLDGYARLAELVETKIRLGVQDVERKQWQKNSPVNRGA